MANLLTNTENFSHADWVVGGTISITTESTSPPAFAGINAGGADTLQDTSASVTSYVNQGKTKSADSLDYVASVYIKKDGVTSRVIDIAFYLSGGTGKYGAIHLNTSTGAIANSPDGTPDASGVVDVDALWWRAWIRQTDNGTNTNTILYISPSKSTTLGGANDVTLTGSVVAWGAQIEQVSAVSTYTPHPFYAFEFASLNVNLTEPILGESRF